MCVCVCLSKDAERLSDELSLQRMKSLSESQRALELERKLFSSERLLKQVTLRLKRNLNVTPEHLLSAPISHIQQCFRCAAAEI